MIHPTIAHIDLNALQFNLQRIKALAPNSKILAMIKKNAYGHDAIAIARVLAADSAVGVLGVIFLKEALQLCAAGVAKPIVVLSGFADQTELLELNACGLETVIHDAAQIEILETTKLTRPLQVWLKIDTGMHRLGFALPEVKSAYHRLMQIPELIKPLRLMTHFSDADNLQDQKTKQQMAKFIAATEHLVGDKCMANSAALLNFPESHVQWVRPGITLYGVSPLDQQTGLDFGLLPVMTLTSRLIATHELEAGEAVGYGSTWICPEKMRVGIVAIGYGDGYPRNTRSGTPVLVNGIRTQIIGRVAMDMTTIDLRPAPQAKIGDVVTVWGRGLAVEEVARGSDSIPYELFCRLTSRVHYEFC